ncbi:MAG: AI-2E family transporter [Desulfobacteraceae bacterium]|nr:MAG: AI-2E family transporter [Desulfobacteraceae bacterium]
MKTSQILVTMASFVVIVAGMRAAEAIINPFLLAVFIAIISASPMFWLQKKGVPAWLSILIVVLGILLIGVIISTMVGTSVRDFSKELPTYQASLKGQTTAIIAWLDKTGFHISRLALVELLDPGAAMNLAATVLNGLGNVLANAFFILMTVIFILLEASGFPAKIQIALGDPESSLQGFEQFLDTVKQYIAIKTWISAATGIFITVWLTVLGVDYSLLWGLLAFLLNYVPNIGSIIAAIPAVLLSVVQLGPGKALLVAGGYILVNIIMGNVLEPRFMGRGLGLSTLVVFLSLMFWGWILGPVGMLLSVPLTMTAKIALDSREDTKWISLLLGPETQTRKTVF